MTAVESRLAWHSQEGSYKGKVCRASNRSAFDESGVSPYISQEPAGFSALHIDLFIPREVHGTCTWYMYYFKAELKPHSRPLHAKGRILDQQHFVFDIGHISRFEFLK